MESTSVRKSTTPFVRDATGLVREFGWLDGMIMGMGFFEPNIAFMMLFGLGAFFWPGCNVILTIGLFGTLILLPVLLAYSALGAAMPRSGGDYVFASRTLPSSIGFAISVIMVVFAALGSLGFQGYFVTNYILGPTFSGLGTVYGNAAMTAFSNAIVQPWAVFVVGAIMILATCLILLPSVAIFKKIQRWLFAIAFLGYPVIFALLFAFCSHSQFVSVFNSYATSAGLNTSYDGLIAAAEKAGAVIVPPSLLASLAASPFIMMTIAFPQMATYVGGEVKNSTKQIPIAMATSVFGTTLMTAIVGYFVYNTVGYNFISATVWWFSSGASGYPLPAAPFLDYFLVLVYPNLILQAFMIISGIIWVLVLQFAMALMVSRSLFAWSFDRLAPSWLADVSERFHSPVKANIVAAVGGLAFCALVSFNFLGTYFNSVAAWTSAYIVIMIGAALLPLKRALFDQSPNWVKKKIGGLPLITVYGVVGAIALGIILYNVVISNPALSGSTTANIAIIGLFYLVPILLYYGIRAYRKRGGLDIDMVFKQLPPE